jgi:hypothetical protein
VDQRITLPLDGIEYQLRVVRKVTLPGHAPRLVVVCLQPNDMARKVLEVCVRGVRHFTPEPHELWVVDNNSPEEQTRWLLERPDINVVLNRTEPLPPEGRGLAALAKDKNLQTQWGSYANAIGLEIAARLVDPATRVFVTLHMDTTPCKDTWLSHLIAKLGIGVAAAGVRMDRARTSDGVLHVLGYAVDFQLFRNLNLDFFPDLPAYDVGDKITTGLRAAGYEVYACANTFSNPELVEKIPHDSPFRSLHVDRVFDDAGNVIFLHLGRGVAKSDGRHSLSTLPDQWIQFCEENLFAAGPGGGSLPSSDSPCTG